MQEGEQISRSSLTKVEGDRRPSSPEHDKGAEAYAKAASVDMDGQTCGEGKSSKLDDVSSSAGAANEIEGQMADTVSDASSAATPELVIKKREDVKVSTSGEESRKIPFASGVFEGYNAQEVQSGMLDTIISMEGSLMPNGNSSIRLSWLAEVVRGLDDDEFIFLLNSRVSATTPRNYVQLRGFSDVLEILKEQLYTTNFMKDILHLQLVEQMELQIEFDHQHQQLVDDISMKGASLSEVRGESDILSDELARCKSELHLASRGREDFQKENDFVKRECEKLSSRANELQFRLESSQQEVSRVSTELADCRDLVAALQVEKENLDASLTLMTQERRKLEAESESSNNENRAAELAECKASVQLLQSENINLNGSLALMTEERMKLEQEKKSDVYEYEKLLTNLAGCKSLVEGLEEEKEYFSREMEKLSAELKEQKGFVESLQVEIANLNTIIALISEERDKLGGEKYFLAIENKKLSAELADYKDQIAGLDVECSMVVDDLKEASLHIEQISEENSHLIISLEIYKAKIKELDTTNTKVQSQSEAAGNQIIHFTMPSTEEKSISCHDFSRFSGKGEDTSYDPFLEKSSSSSHAECSLLYQLKSNMYDDSLGYTTFKGHLEQAENLMGILETAIEHMHSHSASFRNSSSNVVAPAVSKLIQAFESKSHIDDHEADEEHSTENQSYAAPYVLSKVQLKNLRAVLKELVLDAENASELYKGERNGRELANAALSKLKVQYEALREQSRELEEANLELLVVYEIIKQHVCDVEEKKGELLTLYEALRQQERIYRMESAELKTKLTDYESGIAALQRQLDELQESSDDKVFAINHQMDILHEEVAERTSVLEKDYNSIIDWFVEADGKLDASVGIMCSTVSVETHDGLDIGNHVAASVEAATKVIADLQEKLEAARGDYESLYSTHKEMNERFNDLQGQNELATSQIHQIYGSLRKLVNDSRGYVEENETSISNEKLLDSLNTRKYDILMEQLRTLLVEKLQLESANDKLNSELMDRTEDIEKMNKRCLGSDVFKKLVEDLEGMVKLEGSDTDTDEPALYLESLIYSLVQKYKEANAKVSLSIENLGSKDIKLNELQEQNDHSSFLVVLRENEVLVFKESLRRAMEDLVAVRSVIQDKVTELEQSEQRVSSLREKLSIAVAKGKGLILQRDGLKQSLAETSSELERCLQELRLKNASLHEMEIKLKTYSEAGERVEALESELSYIRNSATALRESFLLKDSVLQRIEEILEDLELPEHFHAQDVLGKVDWLARSVIGNALPFNDGDQKSSVGGGLYSDAGFVPMDPWKEDLQPASISGEDLRRKYEELQSKFYILAEQNEMLEQSLMERNNLLKRLEEILDRVTMPLQLRSMEPEDRIGWLGSALSDALDHCSSLQQKIDNCETLCESRTAELVESK
ncbi:hypothetical protein RJ639_035464 [Escallonia herrerae]|uniref:Uncharacterized protein n=1 Tax=Escallonia herrerae TaxID=1293975 RepID=A0AA88WP69_9ASTE|nr:hypothetical protein RJ639_035464 [Escallonia herrerae]